jgi:hypothetical protein
MQFNPATLQKIIQERGTLVCTASYDANVGSPWYRGVASVLMYDGYYYATDDNDLFEGPYDTLLDALGEAHLCFGDVDITISVTGLTPAQYAGKMTIDAPAGHVVRINGERWALGNDRQLRPMRIHV